VTADRAVATGSSEIAHEEDSDANQRGLCHGSDHGGGRDVAVGTGDGEVRGGDGEKVLDRGGEALRRADGFLEDMKAHVSEALWAGQATMRLAPAAGEAWSTR
jgi:hypothetical protein